MVLKCKARPHDQDQGIMRPCPLRDSCKWFKFYSEKRIIRGVETIDGPYDFEDEECGKYERSE